MARPGVRERDAWVFILPFLLIFSLFTLWPLLLNAWLAFHDYFIHSGNTVWNGFANFVYLAEDDIYFYPAIKNTLILLLVVPLIQAGALMLALLASHPAMGVFRVIFYLPVIIAVSLAGVVWQQVLKADGLLNGLIAFVFQVPIFNLPDWLNEPRFALFAVMLFFFLETYWLLYGSLSGRLASLAPRPAGSGKNRRGKPLAMFMAYYFTCFAAGDFAQYPVKHHCGT